MYVHALTSLQLHYSPALSPREASGTRWIGVWLGHRAGLDVSMKRNRTPDSSIAQLVDQLLYLAFSQVLCIVLRDNRKRRRAVACTEYFGFPCLDLLGTPDRNDRNG